MRQARRLHLRHHVGAVNLDDAYVQAKIMCDRAVKAAIDKRPQDLPLLGRESCQPLLNLGPLCIATVVRLPAKCESHCAEQDLGVVWLFNKIDGTQFYSLYGYGNIGLASYDDHRTTNSATLEPTQEFEATDLWHSYIGDEQPVPSVEMSVKNSLADS